jgi:hypothetical protein
MKLLLTIITTLLLLNCADNFTNPTYHEDDTAWCSVAKNSNDVHREMYVIGSDTSYVKGAPRLYTVTIDSTKGDSTFISTTDGNKVIVEDGNGNIAKLLSLSHWYEQEIQVYSSDIYYTKGIQIVKCIQ